MLQFWENRDVSFLFDRVYSRDYSLSVGGEGHKDMKPDNNNNNDIATN